MLVRSTDGLDSFVFEEFEVGQKSGAAICEFARPTAWRNPNAEWVEFIE
jgi:hypothetical protein